MTPPLTPEVTAQQSGVSFHDSLPPCGAPEAGPFQRDEESRIDASGLWVPDVSAVSGSAQQRAASTPAATPDDPRRAPLSSGSTITASQVSAAHAKVRLVEEWHTLVAGGHSGDSAVTLLRRRGHAVSRASLVRWTRELESGGFDALLDQRRGHSGRRRRAMLVAAGEVAAIRAANLITNRTRESGSVPEAIRIA